MMFFGLHLLDWVTLSLYLLVLLFLGIYLARNNPAKKSQTEEDFFLGGRKLGKWLQFFLNFGIMTDITVAPATATLVYEQGIGGIWLSLVLVFAAPFYWFMAVWFRRVRLTTMAELFADRFGSRFLTSFYTVFAVVMAILGIAFGNIVALHTLQPIIVKPASEYSLEDRENVNEYLDFTRLQQKWESGSTLSAEEQSRHQFLKDQHTRGLIHSYVSELKPWPFYLGISALATFFIVTGGLRALVVYNVLQAFLILISSLILLPFGFWQLGGFQGLHARVPPEMFEIFGEANHGEFSLCSIAALIFMSLTGACAAPGNMVVLGSAKNEISAQVGYVVGGTVKRFMSIGWGLTGLLALAIFGPKLSDTDQIWGLSTLRLVPIGLIGLSMAGFIGGRFPQVGEQSLLVSSLMVKNLYEPLFPGKGDPHYVFVGRLVIPIIFALSLWISLSMGNAIALLKLMLCSTVVWGAPILLLFLWRRLTKWAVIVQVISSVLFIVVIPAAVSFVPGWRESPSLVVLSQERVDWLRHPATVNDIQLGRAQKSGELIFTQHHQLPRPLYFEDGVVRLDQNDRHSPMMGLGRFNIEVYLVSLLGFDVPKFTPSMLLTVRVLVDALFPLLILILVSCLTPREDAEREARFYARLKTPVGATPEADALAIALSNAQPARFDHTKLFANSDWEFTKWTQSDKVGFLWCVASVGFVLLIFKGLLLQGS